MEPFTRHTGIVAPLPRLNVDTDQIIPKQFLKRIERTGFGEFLFCDWRYDEDRGLNPHFELNDERYQGATILVTGRNFGCGSSREHAVWALHDYGIRAIIAPSYADIFYTNCLSNGLLPVVLPEEDVETLMRRAQDGAPYRTTVDLEACRVEDAAGFSKGFEIAPFYRYRLLNGLDNVGLTLQHADAIDGYEARRAPWLPSVASGEYHGREARSGAVR
jgi:3-isopropylmalate/(R)-2-methylmalate dehydratase small subunit